MQGYKRLYDSSFDPKTIRPGDDQALYELQNAYAIVVFKTVLKTEQGRFLLHHKGLPRTIFLKYKEHSLQQLSFLNLVAEHYERQSLLLGHNVDDRSKIAHVQFLTTTVPNFHDILK